MTDHNTIQQSVVFDGPTKDQLPTPRHDDGSPARNMVEIFHSIKGEGTQSGMPMTFIRFAGCNLACAWCDTPYNRVSFTATDKQLFDLVSRYRPSWVVFTGGEPLLQLSVELVRMFKSAGINLAIESNGQVWSEALPYIDYICFSPKRKVNADRETKYLLSPSIVKASNDGIITISELRYVIEHDTDDPTLADVASTYITFSPLMLDPAPSADFKSGDGFGNRFGRMHAGAYNRCLELVYQHRHRGGRLSIQLHKFLGVR